MSDTWIKPDRVFDGTRLKTAVYLRLTDGRVAEIAPKAPADAPVKNLTGTVAPGFVDLQVNGAGDVLLNDNPSPQAMQTILSAHRRFGTVAIMPTVITDRREVLDEAVEAALAAKGMPGIIGLHIEGPHISVVRRGTHAEQFVRPMDAATIDHVRSLRAADIPVMITIAPEAVTPAQITALAETGAIVSIGHTDATADQAREAMQAGATCVTHLFNAMSPMLNRAPGVVGAAINSTAYAGVICDGVHVADEMIGLAIRARPVADRMFLVSDSMPTLGGSGHFRLYGHEVSLENGRLVNDEGSLAGAHVSVAESVARLIDKVGIAPECALRMAVTVPAELIGRPELATLVGRNIADVLVLDPAWMLSGSLADRFDRTLETAD